MRSLRIPAPATRLGAVALTPTLRLWEADFSVPFDDYPPGEPGPCLPVRLLGTCTRDPAPIANLIFLVLPPAMGVASHAPRLRWSRGSARGRSPADRQRRLGGLPPDEMVDRLIAAGFLGLDADRAADADHGEILRDGPVPRLRLEAIRGASADLIFFGLSSPRGVDPSLQPGPPRGEMTRSPGRRGSRPELLALGHPRDRPGTSARAPLRWGGDAHAVAPHPPPGRSGRVADGGT